MLKVQVCLDVLNEVYGSEVENYTEEIDEEDIYENEKTPHVRVITNVDKLGSFPDIMEITGTIFLRDKNEIADEELNQFQVEILKEIEYQLLIMKERFMQMESLLELYKEDVGIW